MQSFECQSLAELERAIAALPPGCVFRGQTNHYEISDGRPSITTSFERRGCVPAHMLKWSYYSRVMLERLVRGYKPSANFDVEQAILQHYGWRSFFVDVTAGFEIAAWFASHAYRERSALEIAEDCWEIPLLKVKQFATYEPVQGDGYIYAIGRRALRDAGVQLIDLAEVDTAGGRPRHMAQRALLAGPLRSLPAECVVALISAPTRVLAEFAAVSGLTNTGTMFPSAAEDPLLAALLDLPWLKDNASGEGGMDVFRRGLRIPEYEDSFRKIVSSRTAFYRGFWSKDFMEEDCAVAMAHYLADESFYFIGRSGGGPYPKVVEALGDRDFLFLEVDGLIVCPGDEPTRYGKGICLRRLSDGSIAVCDLMVRHPGSIPTGTELARGLVYEISPEGAFLKVEHSEACDCGSDSHHGHHLRVLARFEDALVSDEFTPVCDGVFRTADVNESSDPTVVRLVTELAAD